MTRHLCTALALLLLGCPTASTDDDDSSDDDDATADDDDAVDDDDSVGPLIACATLAFTVDAVGPNDTALFESLINVPVSVEACGPADEVRASGVVSLRWNFPAVTVAGAPTDLADAWEDGWGGGWAVLNVFMIGDDPVFQSAQFGGGNHLLTINRAHSDPLGLDVGADDIPLLEPFSTTVTPYLAFVPDLDDPTAVSDAASDADATISLSF